VNILLELINESDFKNSMEKIILPFVKSHEQTGKLIAHDGVNLFYKKFELENSKNNIVIVHGFTEHTERYNELIFYLLKNNFSVYIFDARCHGRSDRLTNIYNMVHVNDFQDYVRDLKLFLDKITQDKKIIFYAHSMGGAIVCRFLESYDSSNIKHAILSGPMLELSEHDFKKNINLKEYCPGHGVFNLQKRLNDKIYGKYTRFVYLNHRDADHPDWITSGASVGWFQEALKATHEIFIKKNLSRIYTPITLFQYENDETVMLSGQNKFAEQVASCKLCLIQNAVHSILYMPNKNLEFFLPKLFDILNS